MTTTTLVSILIGVAVAALLVVRQLHAQPLNANFRLPLIMQARAQRLPASNDRVDSLTSHRF